MKGTVSISRNSKKKSADLKPRRNNTGRENSGQQMLIGFLLKANQGDHMLPGGW
jgi:hypothetical protein